VNARLPRSKGEWQVCDTQRAENKKMTSLPADFNIRALEKHAWIYLIAR